MQPFISRIIYFRVNSANSNISRKKDKFIWI